MTTLVVCYCEHDRTRNFRGAIENLLTDYAAVEGREKVTSLRLVSRCGSFGNISPSSFLMFQFTTMAVGNTGPKTLGRWVCLSERPEMPLLPPPRRTDV